MQGGTFLNSRHSPDSLKLSRQLFEVNDLNVMSVEELEKLKLGEVEVGGI